MSWFEYGTPRRRHLRKNVWLRITALPDNIRALGKAGKCKSEVIEFVKIIEIRPDKKVLLEFWCRTPGDRIDRFTVFNALVDEDPCWICEGDVGRGYKE